MGNHGSAGLSKRLEIERRRIASQHQKLEELRRGFIDPFARGEFDAARDAFHRLREGLLSHFALEESLHIPALHGAHPEIAEQLARIVAEHREFVRVLEQVSTTLSSGRFDAIGEVVEPLLESLSTHEAVEERLFSRD